MVTDIQRVVFLESVLAVLNGVLPVEMATYARLTKDGHTWVTLEAHPGNGDAVVVRHAACFEKTRSFPAEKAGEAADYFFELTEGGGDPLRGM